MAGGWPIAGEAGAFAGSRGIGVDLADRKGREAADEPRPGIKILLRSGRIDETLAANAPVAASAVDALARRHRRREPAAMLRAILGAPPVTSKSARCAAAALAGINDDFLSCIISECCKAL
jgi:hypothetical protein